MQVGIYLLVGYIINRFNQYHSFLFLQHVTLGAKICLNINFQMEQEFVAGWLVMDTVLTMTNLSLKQS